MIFKIPLPKGLLAVFIGMAVFGMTLPAVAGEASYRLDQINSDLKAVPSLFSRPSLKVILIGTAVVGLTMTVDDEIKEIFDRNRTEDLDSFVDNVNEVGRLGILVPFGLYGVGRLGGDSRLANTSFTALETLAAAGLTVQVLKYLTGRARPRADKGSWHWVPFSGRESYHSFPSGHAMVAWAIATPFAITYGRPVSYIAYTLATAGSLARIYKDAHWASDVVAGSLIGYGFGWALTLRHGDEDPQRFSLSPVIIDSSPGLAINWVF